MSQFREEHQRLDQFATEEIAQAEAELATVVACRTNASRKEILEGTRRLPPASDLLSAYVTAWRRSRHRPHLAPGMDPADVL